MKIILIEASFGYGQTKVIKNLDQQIIGNGVYTIVGQTGSGKTTLLKGIAGLIPAQKGAVFIGNFPIDHSIYRDFISFWDGSKFLYPNLSGLRHLNLLAKKQKRSLHNVLKICNDLKIIDYIKKPIKSYPKEIMKRFDLALSYIDDKPLILLDEPFSDIDEDSKFIITEVIKKLAKRKLFLITAKSDTQAIEPENIIDLLKYSGKNPN